MAAAARVHGGHQHETRGIGDAVIGARHRDFAGFQRLTQRIQNAHIEFRQLIKKQHAIMRERDFAGPRAQAAAGQRRHAGGMMRRAKGAPVGQRAILDFTGDGGDHRHFQQFGGGERGKNRGQARGEHGFARAGRAVHQQVVAARGGNFQRAFGAFLPLDVSKIRQRQMRAADFRLRAGEHLRTLEMIDELDERFST